MDLDSDRRIIEVARLSESETAVFTATAASETSEGVVMQLSDGSVVAYTNFCPHWQDIRLDRGESALVRDSQLVCRKHGAMFDTDDGVCTHGPCEGAVLDTFATAVHDGSVYLTNDKWDSVERGIEESQSRDLSTDTRIGF
ncbi:MAG: Rieske (2Fe-2S) iron-sulfur domain protein [Haloquadratum sp. J07HQX50]|jgi:nitrite reductase/ring-hydroxylating ferredoxin subunit|nr:MAG: Rieske (2Fe-2S) iron-sulfur domain protein [Haloquadratum sp. J07HQX50]